MSHLTELRDGRPELASEQRVEARRGHPPMAPGSGFHRLDGHLIVVAEAGAARMTVDFTDYEIVPGTVVWVRPGQVYRWLEIADLGAVALTFPPGLLDPGIESGSGSGTVRTCWHLAGTTWADVRTLTGILERDHGRDAADLADPLRRGGSRHVLAALALRLLRAGPLPVRSRRSPTFTRFRAAVDTSYARWHAVADYAAALGSSTRTLSRTTRAVTGFSPKQLIDARILLEARRLLAHTPLPVARIGATLGFEDPSNFASWFAIRAGCTPSEFRARIGPVANPGG